MKPFPLKILTFLENFPFRDLESLIFFQNFPFQSFAFLQSLWNAFHYKLLQEIFKYSNLNISIVKILSFQNFEICKFSNFFKMFCTLSSWNLAFFPFQKFTFAKKFITFSFLGILAFLSSLWFWLKCHLPYGHRSVVVFNQRKFYVATGGIEPGHSRSQ